MWMIDLTKGQLILKCLIGVVNFFQKRRKISQLEDILHNLPATAASTSISRFGGSTSIAVRPPSKVEVVAQGVPWTIPISRPFNQFVYMIFMIIWTLRRRRTIFVRGGVSPPAGSWPAGGHTLTAAVTWPGSWPGSAPTGSVMANWVFWISSDR